MPASSSRVYTTRHRARQENKEARYDDIFSAVTRAVQDEGQFGGISRRLIEENSMPVRMRLFSQSSHESSDEDESEREGAAATQPLLQSPSGRPLRRAALVARSTFEAVESLQEASDEAFEEMVSSHVVAVAAVTAKRKAHEESMKRVLMAERARAKRDEGKQRFSCAHCPLFYERHLQLHKHIMENHSGTGCGSCKLPWRVMRQRHECFKCGAFAANIDKHLVDVHYAVSSRRGALLECGLCSRTFEHLKEVVQHEKTMHGLTNRSGAAKKAHTTLPRRAQFHCRACGDAFDSRYLRDQHLTKHFQSVIESVWLTIERMQEENPDRFLMNQCPLCGFVMSSRKSFRTHIIHRHLMYDGHALEQLIGPGVKQEELLTVREHIALEGRKNKCELPPIPVPEVVKEEVHEEEKHNE